MGYLPPKRPSLHCMNQFVFLSFGVDPLHVNWACFIEIGEIHVACSTPGWCTQSNPLFQHGLVIYWELLGKSTIPSILHPS